MKNLPLANRLRSAVSRLPALALSLVWLATESVLTSCGSQPEPAADEAMTPAEAGLMRAPGAGSSEQDSTPMVVRRVWGGTDVDLWGSVSADGRYLAFIDWGNGDVMVREVATGEVERVTYEGDWEPYRTAEQARISPDGEQVAYLWYDSGTQDDQYYELRVIRRGDRESSLLYRSPDCTWMGLWDWSPDGRTLLFLGTMRDESARLMAVSVEDGTVQTKKDFGSADPSRGAISPDGRFAAYALLQGDDSEDGDLFVLNLESGQTTPLVRNPGNDMVLGWSPDGGYVLFASDRTGILAAWIQPVESGRATGEPWLVKANLWRAVPLGFAEEGSFFFGIPLGFRKVHVASIDPVTGAVLVSSTAVSGDRLAEEGRPTWSQDGRYLAYKTGSDHPTISIRSLDTGETRQLAPELRFGDVRWYPGNHHLLVHGEDREGRGGLFRVDVQTGEAEHLVSGHGQIVRLIDWDPEQMKVFYRRSGGGIAVVDLESGAETVLYGKGVARWPALSPDGRSLAFGAMDGDTPSLMVMSSTGGAPKTVASFPADGPFSKQLIVRGITWSPDSQSVIYAGGIEEGIWRVPAAGGPREKLGALSENIEAIGGSIQEMRVHPDGHHIAFGVRKGGASEVWVMENFLPRDPGSDESHRHP
jgi:Tol biopolymer transport system component